MRLLWLLIVALAGVVTGYLWTRFESDAPEIHTSTTPAFVNGQYAHEFRFTDQGTGLERVRVWLEVGEDELELEEQLFRGNLFVGAEMSGERRINVSIDPAELGIPDGPATLRAEAHDYSWGGNVTEVEVPLVIDTQPPRISLSSGLTYARPGGTRVATYSLGEEVKRHGVRVGEQFFSGYPHPSLPGHFAAFYAIPLDATLDTVPQVVAIDRSGNEATVGTPIRLIEHRQQSDVIELSDGFMQQKVAELLPAHGGDVLEGYLEINRGLRRASADRIREICRKSNEEMLWRGAFQPLPNAARRAGFGDRRTYRYQGRDVDRQLHLGLDMASTSRAAVPAANDGIVAFADDLAIYGRTVIVDHGMGLFTLYAHLSDLSVAKADVVSKGDLVGHSGATGLAGGDHLHFAVIVGGEFADPFEWLDESWIQDHVHARLGTGPETALPAAPAAEGESGS